MNVPPSGAPKTALVPVISAWASKINWAVIISMFATILAIWNIVIPVEVQTALVAGILAFCVVLDAVIMVFRTFFTKSVTPSVITGAPTMSVSIPPAPTEAAGFVSPEPVFRQVAMLDPQASGEC